MCLLWYLFFPFTNRTIIWPFLQTIVFLWMTNTKYPCDSNVWFQGLKPFTYNLTYVLYFSHAKFPMTTSGFHFSGMSLSSFLLFFCLGIGSFCRRPFSFRLFRKAAFRFRSPYLPNLPPMTTFPLPWSHLSPQCHQGASGLWWSSSLLYHLCLTPFLHSQQKTN